MLDILLKKVDELVYKLFFEFMFYSGCRPGETMALRFNDLSRCCVSINKTIDEHCDSETGKREIDSPKTFTSYRNVKIDIFLNYRLNKLKNYYISKYNDSNYDYYIFGGIKPLSSTTVNRRKVEAAKKANVKTIKLHEFRHSHATLLLKKGILIHEIAKRLGHSDINVTLNTYTHTDLSQEKRVLRVLTFLRLI